MAGDHQLLAASLDLDLALPAADAQGLDRQQPAVARRLRDVTGGRHLRAVEAAHQRAALVDLPHVAEEDGLMNDRAAGAVFADDGLDDLKRVVGLLSQPAADTGRGGGEHVPHVVQVHNRVADSVLRHLANCMARHDRALRGGTVAADR